MKITKEERQKLLKCKNVEINFNDKCDLCGHIFIPIRNFKDGIDKAKCPNCKNITYITPIRG